MNEEAVKEEKEHKKLMQKVIFSGQICQIDNILSYYAKGDETNGNRFLLDLREQIQEFIQEEYPFGE